jgi:DNA replicative helicase MCM subunit Mcm2 (Cdc46/Mcm family)
MKPEKYFVFQCRKCKCEIYIQKDKVEKLLSKDCPSCGEESFELWTLVGCVYR